ncbi:hypothetical protein D8M05_05610 [Oceanobacillus bengalensis]|uniref:Permease n=1 Tax=Oceanobacillus bengalensis TaxID=1435466 RepID=A0A494Z3T2_9BACI|nr:hypothetical protein D8M05_05610 [Oceanobacillus bengalensis]
MSEFHLSFKNKKVRIWFYLMIPAILLSILLIIYFPNNLPRIYNIIPSLPVFIAYAVYYLWSFLINKKNKR